LFHNIDDKNMEIKVKRKEAKMAENKSEDNSMEKPITSFGFDASKSVDEKVLSLVNNFSSLHPGIPALSLLRNLLLEVLPKRIEQIQSARREEKITV